MGKEVLEEFEERKLPKYYSLIWLFRRFGAMKFVYSQQPMLASKLASLLC